MGHRVHLHESKCRHPHGHRYVAEFEAYAPELDNLGRIVDFSVLKERIGGFIDALWDHAFMVYEKDPAADFMENFPMDGHQVKLVRVPFNPTAENLASYLLHVICPDVLVGTGVVVRSVVLHETPNGKATAKLD